MPYDNLPVMANYSMLGAMPMMNALKGAVMIGSSNFEKGRIVSDAVMNYKDKESEKKAMEFYAYVKPQTGALLRYVPANSIGAASYGLDGEKLYAMLAAMPGYGMMLGNPMIKQVFDAFDGDCVISFSGMTPDGRYPVASLLVEVNDPAVLQTIVTNLAGMPIQQTAEGEYMFSMGGISVLFGVKNKVLYCTTDVAVKSALDGTKIESLTSLDRIVKGKSGTFWLDFKGLNALVAQLTRRIRDAAGGNSALGSRYVRRPGGLRHDGGRRVHRQHGRQGAECLQNHLRHDRRADPSVYAGSE